ncbi:HDOD domain-containing protein [Leeia sp. TBRC 13508]|uniref:HDOD domain-containing protein n=1 Tax=Leeia speluncae TaxID=2884804 RepID=A0ABS8D7Z8_9NEIS|nr:HDOD domain-containing protein [Leeia speluncae]MCB6184312.1 HDOD domain-containing protein [Leeia speluncae]
MNMASIFEKTHQLPTIPKVVQELIDSFNQEDVDISSIAKKVALDQVLTAKVLRLANSAHYGASRTIGSVDDAVVILGFNSLRTLVIASGITGSFNAIPGFDTAAFWKHCLHSAAIAKWLAKHGTKKLNQELAFTAGLMHGIGQLLIHIAYPKESATLHKTDGIGSLEDRIKLEQAAIGIDHAQVGAELAKRWNFPLHIQQAIALYATPTAPEAAEALYAQLTHLAVFLATGIEQENIEEKLKTEFPAAVAEVFSFNSGMIEAALSDLKALAHDMDGLL